jgi:GT2 family glycosyltransferase
MEKKGQVAFVVIGRNEGERLKKGLLAIQSLCLDSPVVYVDSGSSDDSVAFAESLNLLTVELDMSIPFTAARARNSGFERLMQDYPEISYVQFMDGDCELLSGWIEAAVAKLEANQNIGIVSGRRTERYPEVSIYNELIDIEWNTPIGETLAVLGDMCVKVEAFKKVNGFDETIIAAEDDDFCLRTKKAGFKTFRIDADMSLHDANILTLSQWFRRSKRGGHGYANIHHIHGHPPLNYFQRQIKSVVFWGFIAPLGFLVCLFYAPLIALLFFLAYSASIVGAILRKKKEKKPLKTAIYYGILIFTGKVPEFIGMLQFYKNHLLSNKHQLIEYK